MTHYLPIAVQRPWAADPDVKVMPVPVKMVPAVFPTVVPLLAQTLTSGRLGVMGRLDTDDLFRLLLEVRVAPDGTQGTAMQLFLAIDTKREQVLGALVTEILDYPKKRVLSLAFLGGIDMPRWADCIKDLELWAKDAGCHQVEIPGRHGWERVFRALGYRPITYTCAREL